MLCGTVAAQERVQMSLDSCLRYAYSHNITLQNAQLNRESAEAALSGAKMNFLPALNASASQGWAWNEGRSHSSSYGVNGSLTLFDGLSYEISRCPKDYPFRNHNRMDDYLAALSL